MERFGGGAGSWVVLLRHVRNVMSFTFELSGAKHDGRCFDLFSLITFVIRICRATMKGAHV